VFARDGGVIQRRGVAAFPKRIGALPGTRRAPDQHCPRSAIFKQKGRPAVRAISLYPRPRMCGLSGTALRPARPLPQSHVPLSSGRGTEGALSRHDQKHLIHYSGAER